MKVIVTGSSGFIGYHVCNKLLNLGYSVIGVDNHNDYYDISLKLKRLYNLIKLDKDFIFYNIDLKDINDFFNVCKNNNPDCVIHLAAQAGVRHSIEFPLEYEQNNISAFLNVLEAIRHTKTPKLIYASSSSVYGDSTSLPLSEFDATGKPLSLYAATKQSNESFAASYSKLYKFQTIGLRFFTVYGAWGRPDMAMWKFSDLIYKNKPISLYGNGEMWRDFTYIDDIVNGIILCLENKNLNDIEIFNLGSGEKINLKNMVDILSCNIGKKPIIKYLPMQMGDIRNTLSDITKAKALLNYCPSVNINYGIKEFVKWYKKYHKKG